MNIILKQQLYTRWDSLPDILREAIASDFNSQLVLKTGADEHLSDEKTAVVSKLTGYVLMGFIHPEDLANEIKNDLGIDARIAAAIAEPINRKIFQPLHDELEQIYAPAGEEKEIVSGPAPVSMDSISSTSSEQISSPQVEEIGKPQALRETSGQAAVPAPVPTPAAVPVSAPAPQIPKPAAPPTSALVAPKPAMQTGALPQSMIQPKKPVAVPPPNLPVSETPEIKPMAKITPAPKEPTAQPGSALQVPSGQTNPPQAAAAPFILHQETEFQPMSQAKSDFKITLSQEQFGKMEQKWTAPPKAAQIETGSAAQPPESRVVHYSEMRTPVAPALGKVDSINPPQVEVPKPPTASEPMIPKPVVPPAPSARPMPEIKMSMPAQAGQPEQKMPAQPTQPRFPVSQPEQKMSPPLANPFGTSDRNNSVINRPEYKSAPIVPTQQ